MGEHVNARSIPEDAAFAETPGLTLNRLDAIPILPINRQIVPARPKGHEHGVPCLGQSRQKDSFRLSSLVIAVHDQRIPTSAAGIHVILGAKNGEPRSDTSPHAEMLIGGN